MSDLKPCPFCPNGGLPEQMRGYVFCGICGTHVPVEVWDSRPIEDALRKDAELFRWLERSAGKWSCVPDGSVWASESGVSTRVAVMFAANGTALHGRNLRDAVIAAMEADK